MIYIGYRFIAFGEEYEVTASREHGGWNVVNVKSGEVFHTLSPELILRHLKVESLPSSFMELFI